MFSLSDIRENVYKTSYSRGKDLYETGGVFDFSYEMYLLNEIPLAEVRAKVRGNEQAYYQASATVDEEFGDVTEYKCECEAFYNYGGICKHCVAMLMTYVNRRSPMDILRTKQGKRPSDGEEKKENFSEIAFQTTPSLKNLLNQYSMKSTSKYMLPEAIYGKVRIEPAFQMEYDYARVEFKIGVDTMYILKNISAFLYALQTCERVHYGKKLDFYHNMEAFDENARRWIAFLQEQNEDKKRQSKFHAYYAYTGGFERTMELDALGIDRFFDAAGEEPFLFSGGYEPQEFFQMSDEIRKPKLFLEAGSAGVFLQQEQIPVISGNSCYYTYEDGKIYRMEPALKGQAAEFFDFMRRQKGEEAYVAIAELPAFCRDMLPILKESFQIISDGFDETLYVPPRPEFELYLDKQDNVTVGAKLVAVYGDTKYNVLSEVAPGEVRDVSEELRVKSLVEPYFTWRDLTGTLFVLSRNEDMLYQLLAGGLQRLSEYMAIYTSENFRGLKLVSAPNVTVGVSLKSDLLELSLVADGLSKEELAHILSKYDRRKKYIRLKNGDFLMTDGMGVKELAEVSQDLQLSESALKSGKVTVPKYRAMYLDAALKNGGVLTVEKNKEFKGMVRNMKTIEDSDYEVPLSLKPVMRGYQKNGFLWLKTLRENGFGGILADDMGLGKTLQVISLLLMEQHEWKSGEKPCRRSLIVCPASLIYNWKKEIERFAPELSAVVIAGNVPEREAIVKSTKPGQILITSYDLLKRDVTLYKDMVFAIQTIDEAQYIKNAGTQAAKGVKQITAAFKLALTGTPIENRLSELWSIFDYLMPGFLYTYQKFRTEIEIPIMVNHDEEKMERLQKMIRPFILRRLKSDVLKDLPEKLEEHLFAKLEGEQRTLYDAHVSRLTQMLNKSSEAEFNSSKIQILAELTKLRQLCCDPALLYENYTDGSAKSDMCMELIGNAISSGHKVLLFSQFTTMLDRLAERLKEAGISYYMLTGAVNKEKRMQMVESFQKDDVPVFCISLKAGGTGLNLTAADIVIHYDPWWNVAVQNQATDRAHRIGQQSVVTVYKLVSEGTIEEKIIAIQERKKELAEQILEGDGMDSIRFTKEEILELLGK